MHECLLNGLPTNLFDNINKLNTKYLKSSREKTLEESVMNKKDIIPKDSLAYSKKMHDSLYDCYLTL